MLKALTNSYEWIWSFVNKNEVCVNEFVKIRKSKVTTSLLIRENEFRILNSWWRNEDFFRIHELFLGRTTVIRAFLSKQFVWHVILSEKGDFKLSIDSLNNEFPYTVEGLLNILQSAQHGGKR